MSVNQLIIQQSFSKTTQKTNTMSESTIFDFIKSQPNYSDNSNVETATSTEDNSDYFQTDSDIEARISQDLAQKKEAISQ